MAMSLMFLPSKGSPKLVPRVLDVLKGKPCFVVGTVYMDMPLKPNVLEDIGRDVSSNVFVLVFPLRLSRSTPFLPLRRQKKYTRRTIKSCLRMNRVESSWLGRFLRMPNS